jgi:malate synthase
VAIQYVGAWLVGQGAGADLQPDGRRGDRRDLALQVWQWIRSSKGRLDDGRKGHRRDGRRQMIPEELAKIRELLGVAYASGNTRARQHLRRSGANDAFVEFLTLPAYERID